MFLKSGLLGLAIALLVSHAHAMPVFSSDRVAFEAAHTITDSDDFEYFGVGPGGVAGLATPAVRGSFTYAVVGDGTLVELGAGVVGPTKTISPNLFASDLQVSMSGFLAFGFDVYGFAPGPMTVTVFDLSDAQIGLEVVAVPGLGPFFVGISSPTLIGRVLLTNVGAGPIIDDVIAGAPTAAPVVAPLALAAPLMLGTVLLSRRRAR